MIALSTIGPIASDSPASVMTLIVLPVAYRQITPASTDDRDVMTAIAVIRHWPRKSRITSEQSTAPSTPSCDQALDRLADVDRLVHDELQVDARPAQPALTMSGTDP